MVRPYDDAPRLPPADPVDLRSLVRGEWIELEIGPGRGWFLVERAAVEPRAALIGLEIRRKWAAVVDARLAARGLGERSRVFAEDASIALPRLHPDGSIRRAFVHFPDPWWKKRHQKRLVVRPAFLHQIARLLEPGGELYLQTDVADRAQAYEDLVAVDDRLVAAGDAPGSARLADNPYGARSPRERRAIEDGLPVHRLRWTRRALAVVAAVTTLLVLAWARPGEAAVRVDKGPYLTSVSESGVEVRFELDHPGPASVEVSPDPPPGPAPRDAGAPARVFESRDRLTFHVVRAAGLQAATRYAYAVRAGGAVLARGRFATAPKADRDAGLTFLVYGDDRTDPAAHAAVARAMVHVPSDFLVNTGDMVEDGGSAADWQSFFDIEGPLLRDRALFVAIGNHELYDDRAGSNFARYFGFAVTGAPPADFAPRLFGTTRLGNVRLYFLNAMDDWSDGEERRWLERALAQSDDEPGVAWRIVVMHHGPWSSGPHGGNPKLLEARVPELLAAHKVDLLLAGHDHIYERGQVGPLKYIVSGGGGAPLYRVVRDLGTARRAEATYHFVEVTTTGDALQIVAHRLDGTILDRCGLRIGGSWDCDAADAGQDAAAAALPAPAQSAPSSRCGCDLPGKRVRPMAMVVGAIALAGAGLFRIARRERRG